MLSSLYIKLISVALILAALFGFFFYVKHLKTEISSLRADKIVLETNLNNQNAAILEIKKQADIKEAAGKIEIAKAKKIAEKNKQKAKVIYKTKPSTPGNTCEADRTSALDLVNGDVK